MHPHAHTPVRPHRGFRTIAAVAAAALASLAMAVAVPTSAQTRATVSNACSHRWQPWRE